MANTITTDLMPRIITEAMKYLRNNNQFIAACEMDFQAEAGKLGQTFYMGSAADLSATAVTAANVAPAPSAISLSSKSVTLDREYKTSFALTGREVQENDITSTFKRQIDSAVAGLLNQINSDLWSLYYKIPYVCGNAASGMFASDQNILSDVDKILFDNKAESPFKTITVSSKDYAAALKIAALQNSNTYGGTEVGRRGVIQDLLGFQVLRDQQVPVHVKGTITGSPEVTAETAAGETSVGMSGVTGASFSLKQGDIVEFGDGYSYSVQADVAVTEGSTGTITIDRGLEATLSAGAVLAFATTSGTFDSNSVVSIAGDYSGIGIAARLPLTQIYSFSTQGQHFPMVDSVTGFPLLMSIYGQYKQIAVEMSSIYGMNIIEPRKLVRVLTYSTK